jgi:hypothetical protein
MKLGVLAITIAILLPFGAMAGPAPDMDSDGTVDVLDNCKLDPTVPTPCGTDEDMDGYGASCDADYNQDGVVDFVDIPFFVAALGAGVSSGRDEDHNCDGVVDFVDIPFFTNGLGLGTPGPSGLPCAGTVPCP